MHPPFGGCAGLWLEPLGTAEGERAGTWRRTLAANGVAVHQADCLIAAVAVGIDADLATGNPRLPDVDDST